MNAPHARSLVSALLVLAFVLSSAPEVLAARAERELRVCADPNNLPFSNLARQGFENQLAELLAKELHAELTYVWWPQRRGFLRRTLRAHLCDVVMGLPTGFERVLTTKPVYRSGYVFVSKPSAPRILSLDAAQLRELRIGVSIVGDDGANPPPVTALIQRHLLERLHGYPVYGDYRQDSPPAELIRALARDEIDIAIAWGPLAGYFAQLASPRLRVVPVPEAEAPAGMPFTFDISLAVRSDDRALRDELNSALDRRRAAVRALLAKFHVPLL
jgi:mxaJ protein